MVLGYAVSLWPGEDDILKAMSDTRIVLVVPCFNEAERLRTVRDRFVNYATKHRQVEFLFVDDGSIDDTSPMLQDLCDELEGRADLLRRRSNGGKAAAVRQGMAKALESGPDFVGYWDADLATPLVELDLFLSVLEAQPETLLVAGCRVESSDQSVRRNRVRYWAGRIIARAIARSLRLPIRDTQCGAKLFRVFPGFADIWRTEFCSNWLFDVEVIIRLRDRFPDSLGDTTIFEKPLSAWRDVPGSKVRPLDFFRAFGELSDIRARYGAIIQPAAL
jgi:dolichyl-phosphate beta-glucosyltransferase